MVVCNVLAEWKLSRNVTVCSLVCTISQIPILMAAQTHTHTRAFNGNVFSQIKLEIYYH